ncbi:ATP-grasp fold amidoligase family protein, partial [Brachyspira hyodysenteriae]
MTPEENIRFKEKIIKEQFKNALGYELNLENPKTFNEKLQWLKLYYHDPLMTICADKYLVRDYVKEKIGEEYLVPLIGVWDRVEDIDFDSLPNQFV